MSFINENSGHIPSVPTYPIFQQRANKLLLVVRREGVDLDINAKLNACALAMLKIGEIRSIEYVLRSLSLFFL